MNIPGYDEWRLQGPDEQPDPVVEGCDNCGGIGFCADKRGFFACPECEGTGEVDAEVEEPDGDYEYERRRDLVEDKP